MNIPLAIIYLQFSIQVCFLATVPLVFRTSISLSNALTLTLTLTYNLTLQSWRRWGQDESTCQITRSKVILLVRAHTHSTHLNKCLTWTTKTVGKCFCLTNHISGYIHMEHYYSVKCYINTTDRSNECGPRLAHYWRYYMQCNNHVGSSCREDHRRRAETTTSYSDTHTYTVPNMGHQQWQ